MSDTTIHLQDYSAPDGVGRCGVSGTTMSHHELKRGTINCPSCLAIVGTEELGFDEYLFQGQDEAFLDGSWRFPRPLTPLTAVPFEEAGD